MVKISFNNSSLRYLIITQIVAVLGGFLVNLLWVRVFGLESFGHYQLLIVIFSMYGALILPGMSHSMVITAAEGKNGTVKFILAKKIKYALIFSPVLFGVMFYYQKFSETLTWADVFFVTLIAPVVVSSKLWESWITGSENYKKYLSLRVVYFSLIFTVIFIATVLELGFPYYLTIISTALLGITVLFAIVLGHKNETVDYDVVGYGTAISFAILVDALAFLDRMVVEQLVGPEKLGTYTLSLSFITVLRVANSTYLKYVIPSFIRSKNLNSIVNGSLSKLFLYFVCCLFVGIVGWAFLPYLTNSMYGPEIGKKMSFLPNLWLVVCSSLPLSVASTALIYQKKTYFVYIYSIGSLTIKLSSIYYFVSLFGIDGIVQAFLTSAIFNTLVSFGFFAYYLKEEKSCS